jgi:protein-S-isoprenylcysteine O-methyltransferase Ste14
MYTSVLLGAAGAAVMSHQVLDVLLWFALLVVLAAKALIEERALLLRFPGYQDYKTQTTRFVPWVV